MVGAAIDALGGGRGGILHRSSLQSWFCEALKAGMSSGWVRGVATYAAALGIGLAFGTASSWVDESPSGYIEWQGWLTTWL